MDNINVRGYLLGGINKVKQGFINYHNRINDKYYDVGNKHFDWVDICKGILIIAVVVGHASPILAPYVYIFHIPLFFFLSGYVEKLEEKSMIQVFVQKFLTLIVPYIMINIIFLLLRVSLNLFQMQNYFYDTVLVKTDIVPFTIKIVRGEWITDLGGATWYLACLFITFLLAKLVVIITRNTISFITLIVAAFFLSVGLLINWFNISTPCFVDVACVAVFYLLLGCFCKKKRILDWMTYINYKVWLVVFVIYCLISVNILHASVDWSARNYNNPLKSFFVIFLSVIILMNISKSILETRAGKILEFYGKNSLALMALHFLCFKIIYVVNVLLKIYPSDILKQLLPPYSNWGGILYAVGSIMLFTAMHLLFRKFHFYQYFFLGKINIPEFIKRGKGNKYTVIAIALVVSLLIYLFPIGTLIQKMRYINMPYRIEGVYEDDWISSQMKIDVNYDKNVDLEMELYNPFDSENYCSIFLDDEYWDSYMISQEKVRIKIPVNEGKHVIKVIFENTYVPKELGVSQDQRELSVMLMDGRIFIE